MVPSEAIIEVANAHEDILEIEKCTRLVEERDELFH